MEEEEGAAEEVKEERKGIPTSDYDLPVTAAVLPALVDDIPPRPSSTPPSLAAKHFTPIRTSAPTLKPTLEEKNSTELLRTQQQTISLLVSDKASLSTRVKELESSLSEKEARLVEKEREEKAGGERERELMKVREEAKRFEEELKEAEVRRATLVSTRP